jgi:GlpG protein
VRRKEEAKEDKQARDRTIDVRKRWQSQSGIGPFTLAVIIVSVGVFLLTWEQIGGSQRVSQWLYIDSQPPLSSVLYGLFQDVRSGQVWRLITPVFMHGGFLHLLFNMWWLKDLGTMIERRQSTRLLVAMFFLIALVSNVAQYLVSGPYFVGMSGVVYGLFGYIWVRGRLDPGSGLGMTQFAVVIMMGFFVLCWTGLMGPIANVAHTGGLVVGALWGLASAKLRR